ncbi:MAG: peptidylprolyl isomerase [Methanobacteriota archaeon]|nr:MAG: peptidylprolyl isomerase [Euryarchaeota archaeon]
MVQVKVGDTVRVHYTGKLDDGTIFDTSIGGEPMELTIGEGRIIPGFEKSLIGMSPGESKTVKVPADQAYGPYIEEKVFEVERELFPEDLEPEVGQRLQILGADGRVTLVTVKNVSENRVVLDANHPLAGKDLTFEIELVEIV